ncbi:MAG: OB-fold domain-containing protein, partial [Frankiaceae bacterium]|nr:OB-fold domain-containing protein [Frankiaceae bacterium]
MTENALAAHRPMPEVGPWNKPFWTGGEVGELRLPKCRNSGHLLHPSQRVCQHCLSDDLEWVVVSGNAVVIGVTVNEQMFMPSFAPPYLIAVVALDEAPEVRLTTNLVGVEDLGSAHVGQRVKVQFHEQDGVWFPLFTP